MKRITKCLLFLFALLATERFCYDKTKGFQLVKIVTTPSKASLQPPNIPRAGRFGEFVRSEALPNRSEAIRTTIWQSRSEYKFTKPDGARYNLDPLLKQTYTYLGKGNECYAFVSEDGTTVLKFFKLQLLRLPLIHEAILTLPKTPLIPGLLNAKRRRLERSFQSLEIAFTLFKEETGLIAHNLEGGCALNQTVRLIDRLGIVHRVDLNLTRCLIQKRATLAPEHFKKLFASGDQERAESSLASLLSLLAKRVKMGVWDRDVRIVDNFGFIENEAVEIDIGSFSRHNDLDSKTAFEQDARLIQEWVQKEHPRLLHAFETTFKELSQTL